MIIPVDLGGVPCDYDRIFSIVKDKEKMFRPANEIQRAIGRIIVMADAAHAFGAAWHDKPVGSIADFSNFSFHAVKNFTTAEGGAAPGVISPGWTMKQSIISISYCLYTDNQKMLLLRHIRCMGI